MDYWHWHDGTSKCCCDEDNRENGKVLTTSFYKFVLSLQAEESDLKKVQPNIYSLHS
jgi:hypothetical protein